MTINIVFISVTPLAGAPIRIADALNKFTQYNCRVIVLKPDCYGTRAFPGDLTFGKEALDLIADADILQFFHFMDLESENNPFGINFKKTAKKSAKFVRRFDSDLEFTSKYSRVAPSAIINDPYPKIVIPHYPERTFLDAFVAPNIIPINDEILLPQDCSNKRPKVFFSASSPHSMWKERWNTKGVPEVSARFKSLKRKADFDFQLIQNTPYEQCQKIKRESDIVIGDTTSGSFHLTDFEALSQGKPTFTYADNRSQMVLQSLLKCDDLPFVNARLEEIDLPFLELVKDEKLCKEIGSFSRQWIEKYYSDRDLVRFYVEAYTRLLNDEPLKRQNELDFPVAKSFLYNTLYDLQWEDRQRRLAPWASKIFSVKREATHKVVRLFGLKFKFKRSH